MNKYFTFLFLLTIIRFINATIHMRKGVHYENSLPQKKPWNGKWFPHEPNTQKATTPHMHFNELSTEVNNENNPQCDGDIEQVAIDFDPLDKRHSYNYLCLSSNHSLYMPNLANAAILVEHHIPPAYVPPVKCLNESIAYEETPPTFGAFRLFAPKYGKYKYLPPQRWMHSLAEGAVVMLYHPCAFPGLVMQLENIVKSCLYRHIITPSQLLTPERPLALLVWGKCIQLSVVDESMVVNFIRENAKHFINKAAQTSHDAGAKYYTAGLLNEAHLVTDIDDTQICAYKEM